MAKKFNYDGAENNRYYTLASEASVAFDTHPAFPILQKYIKPTDSVCEFGCGDGSKLQHLAHITSHVSGFDLSTNAIISARKKLPKTDLRVGDSGDIFKTKQFNVTVSFFVLEHVHNPKNFIDNMLEHTKKGGYVICLCPNYGSPFFPSPPIAIDKNILQKISLIFHRIKSYQHRYRNTIYQKVNPITDRQFMSDFDTTAEVSLDKITHIYKKEIVYANSFWELLPQSVQFYPFRGLRLLSHHKAFKLEYLGPQAFFILKKN